MSLKIVTANRLTDGVAVWLGRQGRWVEHVAEARAEADEEGHSALQAIAAKSTKAAEVVDAALIDATIENGAPVPTKLKERIRALGPTVRLDLGKQAERSERAA